MSLVLEALKKLEREKGRDERGFVVMAATPWPMRAARRWPLWLGAGVAAAAVAALVLWRDPLRAPAAPPASVPAAVVGPPADVTATEAGPLSAGRAPTPRRAAAGSDAEVVKTVPAPPVGVSRAVAGTEPAAETAVPPIRVVPSPLPDPALRLQAISERDGQPVAIVNDHLVRIGDEFDGMRVLAIRDTEVDVEIRGRRVTLRF
jgi:hypothetical protein